MKSLLLSLLIAVLGFGIYGTIASIAKSFQDSTTIIIFFLVFFISFATMIILKRIKKNNEELHERLDEIEKMLNNVDQNKPE